MSKNDVMVRNVNVEDDMSPANQKNFYVAVDDMTFYVGFKDNMNRLHKNNSEYDERVFSDKFVSDPKVALINLIYAGDSKSSNDPKCRKNFFDHLKFNNETNCYEIDEYCTIGTLSPLKDSQAKKFARGEFEAIKIHHEMQVMRTTLVKI